MTGFNWKETVRFITRKYMKWNQSGNNEIELFQVWLKVNCKAPFINI
jgi:hypothetical protein